MINCVAVGNLVDDPVLTPVNDTHVVNFSIAVDERIPGKDGYKKITTFLPCVAWDESAKNLAQYCKKGQQIAITFAPRKESWEKEGEKRSKWIFRVLEFSLLGKPQNQ